MRIIHRNPEVMWREEDEAQARAIEGLERGEDVEDVGTALLFTDGMMVTLNLLGTEVWKQCDGKTVDELIESLLEQFEVEEEMLREDVGNFLHDLEEKRFIRYEE